MDEPTLLRENQIGITYNKGERQDFNYEIILERILQICEDQIDGIDWRGHQDFYLKWLQANYMKQYLNSSQEGIFQLVMGV